MNIVDQLFRIFLECGIFFNLAPCLINLRFFCSVLIGGLQILTNIRTILIHGIILTICLLLNKCIIQFFCKLLALDIIDRYGKLHSRTVELGVRLGIILRERKIQCHRISNILSDQSILKTVNKLAGTDGQVEITSASALKFFSVHFADKIDIDHITVLYGSLQDLRIFGSCILQLRLKFLLHILIGNRRVLLGHFNVLVLAQLHILGDISKVKGAYILRHFSRGCFPGCRCCLLCTGRLRRCCRVIGFLASTCCHG